MLVIFHEHRENVRNNADPCNKCLFLTCILYLIAKQTSWIENVQLNIKSVFLLMISISLYAMHLGSLGSMCLMELSSFYMENIINTEFKWALYSPLWVARNSA